ncbi:helix-turn-helix domain-containing protein [Nakamurella sp.]|uniref:AlbA family DNA-binding domain-containing protein n=1 Tax=Nakamurella sp. TaxID=1869182 RepID=UPI003B3A9DA4
MVYGQESVFAIAVALPSWLLVAYLIGQLARWLLRGRVTLSTSATTVIAVLGVSGGLLLGGLVRGVDAEPWDVIVIGIAVGLTMLLLALFATVAARLQPARPVQSVDELIRRGESDRLEFKSSARWNLHTKARDEKIELVIAKAVSGFLNADGGTLLIGVNDAGEPVGLANDFAVVKSPDPDRYELWLRDLLATTLGQPAAVQVVIDFTPVTVDGSETYVCRVTCPASPRPVFLRPGKGGTQPELWVRNGNSTRQLKVDEAVDYVMDRWPLGLGRTVAAQLRAAARGSGG